MIKRGYVYLLVLFMFIVIGLVVIQFTGFVSEGEVTSAVSIDGLRIVYDTFNGTTTNFGILNTSELNNLSSMILEKTAYGKVVWQENVNLTLTGSTDRTVNFDVDLNISDNLVSIDSSELPYLNKEVIISLYGLGFSDPQIMKGAAVCSDCTEISYSGGTLIFSSTVFSDAYYVVETPISFFCGDGTCDAGEDAASCPADCDDGGGGGGGGGTPTEDPVGTGEYSFYVIPDFFVAEMNKGTYYQKNLIIVNNGTKDLVIRVAVVNLSDFIFPETNSVSVSAGQNASLKLHIYASNYVNPDVYIGKLLFVHLNNSRETRVILDIKDRYALFDIRTEVLKRYINPGGRVKANVSIVNMGDLRNFDVSLEYKVIDFDNVEYVLKKEDFAINRSFQRIFFLDLSEDIPMGDYLFYVKVYAGNVSASSYDTFTVEKISWLAWLFLIITISVIIFIILLNFAKHKGWWWFAAVKRDKDEKKTKVVKGSVEGDALRDLARSKGI